MVRCFPCGERLEPRRHPVEIHAVGIDFRKTVSRLVGLNVRREAEVRKVFPQTASAFHG